MELTLRFLKAAAVVVAIPLFTLLLILLGALVMYGPPMLLSRLLRD